MDPGIPGPIFGSRCLKLSEPPCADLTYVTLADEYTSSIRTDDVNRVTISNVAIQVAPPGGQTCN